MSVYVSQRFESESIRNLPIRARKNFSSFRRRRRAWEKTKKKCVSLGFRRENDARERINTYRSGAIDDERLDFLRSFLCCWGHFYVWLFFICLMRFCAWKCVVCSMGQRGKSDELFFSFFIFSIVLLFTQSSLLLLWQRRRQRRRRRQKRRWFSTWKDWRCTSRTSTCTRYVLNE